MANITFNRTISTAHRLWEYEGKCNNLHGHNFEVVVTISCGMLDGDMVADWGIVKQVIDRYDHATILHRDDPVGDALAGAGVDPSSIHCFDTNPTTERFVAVLAVDIMNAIDEAGLVLGVTEVTVMLSETPHITATTRVNRNLKGPTHD